MELSKPQVHQLQFYLQQATIACQERCLYQASKWAAEMLNALPDHGTPHEVMHPFRTPLLPTEILEQRLELRELPKYLQAKALFDCHEFQRCAAIFLPASVSEHTIQRFPFSDPSSIGDSLALVRKGISQRCLFLALYALLLAGEKEKTEQLGPILGTSDTGSIINRRLVRIKYLLDIWFEKGEDKSHQRTASHGWLEYLYGVVLAKDRQNELAISWLLKSVSLNCWNWSAWDELSHLIRDAKHLQWVQSQLNPTLMGFIFSIYCRQKMHHSSASLVAEISQVQTIFPDSLFLQGQRALVLYNMRDFYEANTVFWATLLSDPWRMDFVDHYSNVLYTLKSKKKLAFVAQLCSAVDRHRPETCCVIGNYYSLCERHEDAVGLFRKALILDRSFSNAWTLLGHEYVQLQNAHAAIECYRRAIALDPHDYRSLIGLGQSYDGLENTTFALYFYRWALKLRPRDADLRQTVSECLIKLSLLPEAAKTLKSAIALIGPPADDLNNCPNLSSHAWCKRIEMLYQLANIYKETQSRQIATRVLELCLKEHSAFQNYGGTDEIALRTLDQSLIPQARLLFAQWSMDADD